MELVARGDGVLRKIIAAEGDDASGGRISSRWSAPPDENIDAIAGGRRGRRRRRHDVPSPAGDSRSGCRRAAQQRQRRPRRPLHPPLRHPRRPASGVLAAGPPSRRRARVTCASSGIGSRARGQARPGAAGIVAARHRIRRHTTVAERQPSSPPAPCLPRRRVSGRAAHARSGRRSPGASPNRIGPVPHFYLTAEIDIERVAEARAAMAGLGDEFKVSFNDLIVKAVAMALRQHPDVNAALAGRPDPLLQRVHVGMAVAVEDGLITPVIFDADQKGLREIAAESRDPRPSARASASSRPRSTPERPSPSPTSACSRSTSSPRSSIRRRPAILAVGAVASPRSWSMARSPCAALRVTMSCDHRVDRRRHRRPVPADAAAPAGEPAHAGLRTTLIRPGSPMATST